VDAFFQHPRVSLALRHFAATHRMGSADTAEPSGSDRLHSLPCF